MAPTLAEDELSLNGHLEFLWNGKELGKAAPGFHGLCSDLTPSSVS